MKKLWIAVTLALLLAACETPPSNVTSNVSVFHQLSSGLSPDATLSVVPWRKEHEGSLEFEACAQQASRWLRSRGLTVVPPGAPARYAVFLDFGIDDGRVQATSYSVPQWGVTGYRSANSTGTVTSVGNTAYVNSTTTAVPSYGVTGYNQVTDHSVVYRRFINVDVVDLNAGAGKTKKVYQGKLRSEGSCGNLPVIMPNLLQALLSDFPGESGSARTVLTPWNRNC